MTLLAYALLVFAAVALALILADVAGLHCTRCYRRWALFTDQQCLTCFRAARRKARGVR